MDRDQWPPRAPGAIPLPRAASSPRPRVAIVGLGDVARRHYLPTLAALADQVEIAALMDPRPGAATAAAASIASSPRVRTYTDLDAMLSDGDLDAAIDLTPAPRHGGINQAILDAGLHLYSEKPLAGSLGEADRLISSARARGLLFLCAPAVAVTAQFGWLADLVASDRLGAPTLIVSHHTGMGPAAWRGYTGDPTPFYQDGVGPVLDHGVYRLHAMTRLLGPVRRVQAMGSIAIPMRRDRHGTSTRQIEVTTPDHVLINLEFAGGALGHLFTSFATPGSRTPWLEVHFPGASISFSGPGHNKDAPVSLFIDDDTPAAREGWEHGIEIPTDEISVVDAGARHFVACLRGESEPVLTAEHARHVLDITLRVYDSIADGRRHETTTTF